MEALLTSQDGALAGASIRVLMDADADERAVKERLREACLSVSSDGILFLYFSGHGASMNGEYYFVPHSGAPIALDEIRRAFEGARCRASFLFRANITSTSAPPPNAGLPTLPESRAQVHQIPFRSTRFFVGHWVRALLFGLGPIGRAGGLDRLD